jgi:hypothetical protein
VRKRTNAKEKRRTVVENKKTRGEGRTAEERKHTKNRKKGGTKGEESGEG